MRQEKKYFGLTVQQLGILGGLAVVACLLFGVLGLSVLRRGLGFSGSPQSAPTAVSTATMIVIPTLTPTVTATPVPYEQLIPEGWKQFKTTLVEIWLPPTFKSVNMNLKEELAAESGDSKTSVYKMRTIIGFEPLAGKTLDEYIDGTLPTIDPTFHVVERRKVSVNGTEAIRMLFEGRVDSVDVNELVYIMQDGGTAWYVFYAAQINEFYETLPSFEQSILTFRIVR
jgi:hypothetical protein